MKAKNLAILLTSLFVISSITLSTVFAGDETNPEVDDDTGDGESEFRDIDAVWFSEDEGGNHTVIHMMLAGSPPGFINWDLDTTTYDYEVYFDVDGRGYAVSVSVQYAITVGGVYIVDIPWQWEFREVTYAFGSDTVQSESTKFNFGNEDNSSATFDQQALKMEWTLHKTALGIEPGRGKELANTWAAIWNTNDLPSDGQRNPLAGVEAGVSDYAHTHYTDPGRSYQTTGIGGIDYNVILSAEEITGETPGGKPIEFLFTADNQGSHDFTVDFYNQSFDETWEVVLSVNSSTIKRGTSKTVTVTITPPKNVENGTIFVVAIGGKIHKIDGDGTVDILTPVVFTVVGLKAPEDSNENQWLKLIMDNIAIIAGVIAVIVVAIIILLVLVRRGR